MHASGKSVIRLCGQIYEGSNMRPSGNISSAAIPIYKGSTNMHPSWNVSSETLHFFRKSAQGHFYQELPKPILAFHKNAPLSGAKAHN
jgi:hypothetical protein